MEPSHWTARGDSNRLSQAGAEKQNCQARGSLQSPHPDFLLLIGTAKRSLLAIKKKKKNSQRIKFT